MSDVYDVFLCHNNNDKEKITKLANDLKENYNIKPWLDEWELKPGDLWQQELEKQIENIKSVAIFIGKNGMGPWQKTEMESFLIEFSNRKCPIIPVILNECNKMPSLPVFLKNRVWLDLRKNSPVAMNQLVSGINRKRIDLISEIDIKSALIGFGAGAIATGATSALIRYFKKDNTLVEFFKELYILKDELIENKLYNEVEKIENFLENEESKSLKLVKQFNEKVFEISENKGLEKILNKK